MSSSDYCLNKMYFYNSTQDEFDATSDFVELNKKIIALDEDDKIQFKLPHKPIRAYELTASEKSDKTIIEYDRTNKIYTLSDLYENEECEYYIVADYGLIKNLYSVQVYNKTYIEKNKAKESVEGLKKSRYDISKSSKSVVVDLNSDKFPYNTLNFEFSVRNMNAEPIICSLFRLEKKIGDIWYTLETRDMSYNATAYENVKKQAECELKHNEIENIKLEMNIDTLFEMTVGNNLLSGIYRIVVPFTYEKGNEYAISPQFAIGYIA